MPRTSSSTTTAKKGKKGNALADANKALTEANARMQGQLEDLRTQLLVARTPATVPRPSATLFMHIIPRPAGEHGRNWNLYNKLAEVDITRSQYNHMLAKVRDNAKIAQIDCTCHYRDQDPIKLAQIFAAMRKRFPILKRFRCDWATAEMLKQCLRNWRSKAKLQELNGDNEVVSDEPIPSRMESTEAEI